MVRNTFGALFSSRFDKTNYDCDIPLVYQMHMTDALCMYVCMYGIGLHTLFCVS